MPAAEPPPDVATALEAFAPAERTRLLELRRLILETAEYEGVGPLTETLKWGEPAYLTNATKAGSTIRLGVAKGGRPRCALYLNCNTTLVDETRALFGDVFDFEGDRGVLIRPDQPLPEAAVTQVAALALTYHRRRKRRAA